MKRILSVILSIFVASSAIAQEPGFQNEADSTVASTAGTATKLATDSKGKLRLAASAGSNDFTGAMPIAPLAVGTDTAETDSTTTVILATSHAARVGDYVKFTGGTAANVNVWRRVSAVATNSITVPVAFPSAPANTDPFTIYRPVPNSVTYAEDSVATTADLGTFVLGVANPSRATLAADGDYVALATTVHGAAMVSLDATAVTSAGNQPVRTEDAAFAASDAVMMAGALVNPTSQTTTANDIVALAANRYGALKVDLNIDVQGDSAGATGNSLSPIRREDDAFGSLHAVMVAGSVQDRTISVDAGADDDVQNLKGDKFGRLLTTEINQEHLFSCVSASDITDTNSTAVCAADADEIYVIKDICCSNTDTAVATRVNILDGATVVHTMVLGTMVAATPGDSNHCQTFPTGIKGAAINTAINAQAITTSAEIRCSIHGYKVPS